MQPVNIRELGRTENKITYSEMVSSEMVSSETLTSEMDYGSEIENSLEVDICL
ncbi:MAG: hypothetical protein ABEK59_09605 [Halobacteria archaeon]